MSLPSLDAEPIEFTEWLEIAAFLSETGRAPLVLVVADQEVEEEAEPTDLVAEDQSREGVLTAVKRLVWQRARDLGDAYPFKLTGGQLRLVDDLNVAQHLYLYALVVSHGAPSGILDGCVDLSRGGVRDLFEAAASFMLAGAAGGPAYIIGGNRRGGVGFLEKLREVYAEMGDGTVVDTPPAGAPADPNDDGVDVVSWSDEATPPPRVRYFVGQAATGENWVSKNTRSDVDLWHRRWFVANTLQSIPTACTIIPFDLDWWLSVHGANLAGAQDDMRTVRQGFVTGKHAHLGSVFDRTKLAEFTLQAPADGVVVEGTSQLDRIRDFVSGVKDDNLDLRP